MEKGERDPRVQSGEELRPWNTGRGGVEASLERLSGTQREPWVLSQILVVAPRYPYAFRN